MTVENDQTSDKQLRRSSKKKKNLLHQLIFEIISTLSQHKLTGHDEFPGSRTAPEEEYRRRASGLPTGQRGDGGVGVTVGIAALSVGGQGRLLPLPVLSVGVIHRQRDEGAGLPVREERRRKVNEAVMSLPL